MAKGTNQKLKLVYLTKIMLDKTDDEHSLTMAQIIEELAKYDISAERKSIYTDLNDIKDKLGIDIIKESVGRETYYRVGQRKFELAEIKLLIDAIQASKFITQNKSRELIKKIKGLVSEYQASKLQRQVYVQGRVKTMNESIYYNVDDIYNAIAENKKIRFKYYKWNTDKVLEPRHNNEYITVSPWALTWNDANYYMVAFDDYSKECKHYRVDKMKYVSITDDIREGKERFENLDIASYSKINFGMYHGDVKKVKIQFPNDMCGIFIDRFGKEVIMRPVDNDNSEVIVDVAVSSQFFGWIFSLGNRVKVTSPEDVVEQMRDAAKQFLDNYRI